MRQKLGYKDQIETEEMTPGIILTCGIITTTSLCHCHVARRPFDTWQFFLKFKKKKKFKKKIIIQKIQELTRGTSINAVTIPVTEKTKLRSKFLKQGPK